jgi:tripartite-type tricarboxylate transporter receptor subunit TctC
LRGLAICAEQRWADLPDVPTMAEAGYPNFVFAVDAVLMAPAKTPPANVKWLEAETLKVLSTQDIKDKFFQAGFFVRAKGADAAWDRVSKEITLFKDVIDKAGIKKL